MRPLIAVALLFLTGCATFPMQQQDNYEMQLQTWLGQPSDALVSQWGVPAGTMALDSGGKVLTYTYRNESYDTTYNQYTRSLATDTNVYSCVTSFTTDKQGVIIAYNYRGNACRSR